MAAAAEATARGRKTRRASNTQDCALVIRGGWSKNVVEHRIVPVRIVDPSARRFSQEFRAGRRALFDNAYSDVVR